MDFFQRTPFFRLLVFLILGILLFQFVELFHWSLYTLFILSFLILTVGLFLRNPVHQYKFRWLFGSGIFLFLTAFGYFISHLASSQQHFEHLDSVGLFRIELIESPIEKQNSYLCRIKTLDFYQNDQCFTSKGKALVYFKKDSLSAGLTFGDQLLVRTKFIEPDGQVNPEGFNYRKYLNRQGIGATTYMNTADWSKLGHNNSFSIFSLADSFQKKMLSTYKSFGIQGDEYAVLAALTLGSKDALHPELRQNYTTSGGMHILAVSGLHVGVIYLVLNFLLSFLGKGRYFNFLKVSIIVLGLWVYAFITGLPPSVIRATSMFSMIAIGFGLTRKSHIYNTICASAFLMLLVHPNYLFDVGFQLSYCAVISIVYFQPKIVKWFYIKNKILKWGWELTAVSLAAQIGTAPLSLFYFHQFSNYFLVTNFIAIPFATFIIYTAVTLLAVSAVPFISTAVAFVLQWMLKILNSSIHFIQEMPFALSVYSITAFQVILLFGMILLFSFYFKNKKYFVFTSGLVLVLLFVTINLYINLNSTHNKQLVVYSDSRNTHIDFIYGKTHCLLTTDSVAVFKVAQNYWLNKKLKQPISLYTQDEFNDGFFEFEGKRIYIVKDEYLKGKTTIEPLKVDYLIIGNHAKIHFKQLLDCVQPRKVVVDNTIAKWYATNIEEICVKKGIKYYSVERSGAYILNLGKN